MSKPVNVFLSYSHQDEELLRELLTHLSPLRREGLIAPWYDREISAGDEWADKIKTNLEQAHIILFLVSADFIASDYCYEIEMERALERHYDQNQTARVIPVIVRDCDWSHTRFAELQALPTEGKAVMTWGDARDTAWTIVVKAIRERAERIQKFLSQQQPLDLDLIVSIRQRSVQNADRLHWEYEHKLNNFKATVRDAFQTESQTIRNQAIAALQDNQRFGGLVEQDILWFFRLARLEKYLQSQQWYEADEETLRIILLRVGTYTIEDLGEFPVEELRLLDGLWVNYSRDKDCPEGRFGFSVHKNIYLGLGRNLEVEPDDEIWTRFGEEVGWRDENGDWRPYPPLPPSSGDPYPRGNFPDFKMCQNRGWMWALFRRL